MQRARQPFLDSVRLDSESRQERKSEIRSKLRFISDQFVQSASHAVLELTGRTGGRGSITGRARDSNQRVSRFSRQLPLISSTDPILALQTRKQCQDGRSTAGNHSQHHHDLPTRIRREQSRSRTIPPAPLSSPLLPPTIHTTTLVLPRHSRYFSKLRALPRHGRRTNGNIRLRELRSVSPHEQVVGHGPSDQSDPGAHSRLLQGDSNGFARTSRRH